MAILLLLTCVFTKKVYAQNNRETVPTDKIHFIEDDWKEALKQAKAQHKFIFTDCYATWCGPCKMLRTKTFTNPSVAAFFNRNFINVSIDMEKGMGPQLAANWGIQAYPTLIVFDADGKPIEGIVGFLPPATLLKFGNDAFTRKK